MNWLKYLVGFSALIIAGCAAFFSITGLGVLFSGAAISVMVMAGSLEFTKLVAATYLKQKWDEIKGFNKWYLTSAVALLMLITSAGIFGYLSNAFQQQNLKLQQVDREIAVYTTKIEQNSAQITQLNGQLTQLSSTQAQILDKGKVNNRLLRSIDNKDKQTSQINTKIASLQDENAKNNEEINKIKISNLDLEKEVGGFRFVAEAFGVELKKVVKFFIFLIVIVFDPLAVALIIAFNGLIAKEEEKKSVFQKELEEFVDGYDEKTYGVYGDDKIDENTLNNELNEFQNETFSQTPTKLDGDIVNETEKNEINLQNEEKPTESNDVMVDASFINENLTWEPYMHPEFPWDKKELWINNQKAVQYWLNNKGSAKDLQRIKREDDNVKTY
jgi:hypothetical protein